MNALLLYPRFPDTFWSFRYALPFLGKRSAYPPLGLLTIAALLPPHWKARLVDLNVETLSARTLARADVAFISAMLVQAPSLADLVERCRKAGVRTVVGGPVTSAPHPSWAAADHVVRGEAEGVIPVLAADLEAGRALPRYDAGGHPDLAPLPPPRMRLVRMRRYAAMPVQISRGCPFACEFCDIVELFGRAPRLKGAEQVLAEFEQLYRLGWRGSVFVVDDNFVGNRAAVKAMLPRIVGWMRERGNPFTLFTQASVDLARDGELLALMRAANFDKVFVGIETPVEESHRAAGKHQNAACDLLASVRRIQEYGMEVMGGFILGFDQDPPEVFDRMTAFIREAAIPVSMVGLLTALPNTRLWRRLAREGRLLRRSIGDNTAACLNFVPKMDADALLEGYRKVVSSLYGPREYFDRALALLSRLGPGPKFRVRPCDLLALARSLVRQGILSRYRASYWRYLSLATFRVRRHLGLAVTLAVMGHHFFVLRRRIESERPRAVPGEGRIPKTP